MRYTDAAAITRRGVLFFMINLQYMTRPEGPIAYRQHGQGAPLLLLHGWGGSSRNWCQTLTGLGKHYSVYALDLPGYGESPPWHPVPGIERTAALVIECANALGLEQFDLNGHSLATTVAAFCAATAPDRVRRLILTCASTYRSEAERWLVARIHYVLKLWVKLRRPWMAHKRWFYRAIARRFFYRLPHNDEVVRASVEAFLRMDRDTALLHARDVALVDYHAALRRITAPVLIVGARQDNIMPPAGTPRVAELLPNSRLIWIERCGHLPMIERPVLYQRVLDQFLQDKELHTR